MFRQILNLRRLPKNHLGLLSKLSFEVTEYKVFNRLILITYKANQLLACHLYDRMVQHCKNQYGILQDAVVPECMVKYLYQLSLFQDASAYFKTCVTLNAGYGLMKKYFPEYFVNNPYARPQPSFDSLSIK